MLDEMQRRIAKLGDIVRRYAGRHADRNACRAIGKKLREGARQNDRFAVLAVISVAEIDRILVDPVQQQRRDFRHPRFGVSHGGGVIAVHIAEIALPVHQRIAHGEILRETHQRVIDRLVAMRVVPADYVADHAGAFLEAGAGIELELPHRIEHAAMHRLQPVAHIRQRAVHDGGERIGKISLLQRFAQIDVMLGFWGRRNFGHRGYSRSWD